MTITLTSDFGLRDPYVGIMKGVISHHAPGVDIIDLSHQVSPQAIQEGSRILAAATPYFPAGTIHLAVIDPGVGSERAIVCVQHQHQLFLAPDNGLLSPFLQPDNQAWLVENQDFFLSPVSATFHGRDIFAPVAAALAKGLSPANLGPTIAIDQLKRYQPSLPQISSSQISGQISHIDHFGNGITTIHHNHLQQLGVPLTSLIINIGQTTIQGIKVSYSSSAPGSAVALINSNNFVEIAVTNGNASQQLKLSVDQPIKILISTP